jgi:hypothetical protein
VSREIRVSWNWLEPGLGLESLGTSGDLSGRIVDVLITEPPLTFSIMQEESSSCPLSDSY